MQIAFIFALGPLTSALVNRLGCRLTAIVGGLSCVGGLLLSSLASSVYIMYVTYSVLFGFGGSCLYLSSYEITSQYFYKNHAIATGITASGSGLGVLSVAPMLQSLLDSFDWRKTYRITAGIISVVCALCLTFDPAIAKRGESSIDDRKCEEQEMSHEQGEQVQQERKKWLDLSVFKEKVFVVLTLCNTMASIGHNTPRLHLVRGSEWGGPHVGCRLKFPYFVGCRLKISKVGKSQLIFLSLVGNFFPVLSVVSSIFSPFVASRLTLIHTLW